MNDMGSPDKSGRNLDSSGKTSPRSSLEAAPLYDEHYYRSHCGQIPYERSEHWLRFFGSAAERIVRSLHPKTALDAGCAMGLLVEALRDRGVEAYGVDISDFAISQVREDIRPFCRTGSIATELGGTYDLVTCIEVLEHLPPSEESAALKAITSAADAVLFSSSPDDWEEETHFNIHSTEYWLSRFAELGFFPDFRFDAGFLTDHAFVVRRSTPESQDYLAAFHQILALRERIRKGRSLPATPSVDRQWLTEIDQQLDDGLSQDQVRQLLMRLHALEEKLRVIEGSFGWKLLSSYRLWLRDAIRTRPALAKLFEPLANRIAGAVSGGRTDAGRERLPGEQSALAELAIVGGEIILSCDYPPADGSALAQGSLIVHGWAVARSGISEVTVKIGAAQPESAVFGKESPEVALHLPDYPGAANAGYWIRVSTRMMKPGPNRVLVEARSKDGNSAKVVREITIDPRDEYDLWIEQRETPLLEQSRELPTDGPCCSILVPVYQTPLDLLEKCVASVRRQHYRNWELCLCDDGSGQAALAGLLRRLSAEDPRIKVQIREENRGIAAATNAALEMASGSLIGLLDHDDELSEFALAEVVNAFASSQAPDVVYTDEDKITVDGVRYEPAFKPEFSPDLLRSLNYVSHFLVMKAELLRELGGLREGFDGAQDYDLTLRLSERSSAFLRIPKVLYHWRAVEGSVAYSPYAKPEASRAARRALQEHLDRCGSSATAQEVSQNRFRVRYQVQPEPEIAIVLPTGGNMKWLEQSVPSALRQTDYSNFRLLIADNSKSSEVEQYLSSIADPRLSRLDFRGQPFNFSRICNQTVAGAGASHVVFLNDDIEVIATDWLRALAEIGIQPGVGVVGARLLFPDSTIQHAGVVMGLFGMAGHAFRGLPSTYSHYFSFSDSIRNCSAVTGACLFTPRRIFEELGGFDEEMPVAFQDVDYCLKALSRGLRIVYTPCAELYHFESATRRREAADAYAREEAIMRSRWADFIEDDPFYSPNLTRKTEDFSFNLAESGSRPAVRS